jgi:hypothetical protein
MTSIVKEYHGQRYVQIGEFKRERRDGTFATIIRWESHCAQCGAPFEISTSATSSKWQPNRRCQTHKRPGVRVKS